MKQLGRTFLLLFTSILILTPVRASYATVLFTTNGFESSGTPSYSIGTVDGQNGWTLHIGGTTAQLIESGFSKSGSQAMELTNTGSRQLVYLKFSGTSTFGSNTSFYVDMWLCVPPVAAADACGISVCNSSFTAGYATVDFIPDTNPSTGTLSVQDGAYYTTPPGVTYAAGSWLELTLAFDTNAGTYTLYLSGTEIGTYGFGPGATGLPGAMQWNWYSASSGTGGAYMDNFQITDTNSMFVPVTAAPAPLKTLARDNDLWTGVALTDNFWTLTGTNGTAYNATASREYDLFTSENQMKFGATETSYNSFNYSAGDQVVSFSSGNAASVHGHNLIWYNYLPTWVTTGSYTGTALGVLQNHIQHLLSHWNGEIAVWDVVNEAMCQTPIVSPTNGWQSQLRTPQNDKDDYWYNKIGWQYIQDAFIEARKDDPNALLVYNDTGAETTGTISNNILSMLTDFQNGKNGAIPIDGVGFETHWAGAYPAFTGTAGMTANFDRFSQIGLKVFITELDTQVPSNTSANLDWEARIYYNTADAALRCPSFASLQTWGFTDKYSWIPAANCPLPFDTGYNAKPAYYALQDAFSLENRGSILSNGGFEGGLTSWSSNAGATLTLDGTMMHSGSNGLDISARTSEFSCPIQSITSQITTQGAGLYYLSGWLKLPAGAPQTANLDLQLVDSSGTTTLAVSGTISTAWTKVEGWINVAWYKTLSSANFLLDTPGYTGNLTVDDLTVSDGNLVANGGFETGTTSWSGTNGAVLAVTSGTAIGSSVHYGAQSLSCTTPASTQGPVQDITAALLASGPRSYYAQAYMLTGGTSCVGAVAVRISDSAGTHTCTVSAPLTAGKWTRVSGVLGLAWSGTLKSATVMVTMPTNPATYYVDDVFVKEE
jgi:endo-1,4-beta-xylanase